MDLYTTTTNHKGLLTKRQNPYTQAIKLQPSNAINEPKSVINLQRNGFSSPSNQHLHNSNQQNSVPLISISSPQNPAFIETIQTNFSERSSNPQEPISIDDDEDDDSDDCSGPIFEKIEKKTKTSMLSPVQQKIPRRFSYDEDKHSDHSTFCETHSEGTANNESGDFPCSPSMNHNTSKSSDLKSDSIEEIPVSPILNSMPSTAKTSPMSRPQDLINNIADNLAACDFQPGGKQKMRCKLNHQYEFELSNISKRGCNRCQELLEECRQFAMVHNGRCTNEEYDQTISYQCHKGHTWNLNYKNAKRRWCAQCAKDERNLLKKKCEEDKQHREKEEEKVQQNLFEEARKKAMKENQQNNFGFGGQKAEAHNNQQKPVSAQEYFQRVDFEIETLAKKYSNEFMAQKEFQNDVEYTQILQVYKILIMPEQILQCYMFNLNGDALRSEFRRMAKIIHPDKNKHPQAGAAFQKIYKVYEVALNRVEGK